MKQDNIQRFKTGALALFMVGNMALTGCTSQTGFMYKTGKDNAAVAYKDSYIKGVEYAEYFADSTSPYTDTLIITKTADASFVGADAVKAFVFDNISDLKPLTDAFVAQ